MGGPGGQGPLVHGATRVYYLFLAILAQVPSEFCGGPRPKGWGLATSANDIIHKVLNYMHSGNMQTNIR